MPNNQSQVYFNNVTLPILYDCDFMTTKEAFYHADRKLPFHVLIYVIKGCIYVSEEHNTSIPSTNSVQSIEATDYEVSAGSILFLKKDLHHYGKILIPEGTSWYYAHFDSDMDMDYPLFSYTESLPFSTEDYFSSKEKKYNCPLPKQISGCTPDIKDLFDNLVEKMHNPDSVNYLITPALFHNILATISYEPYAKKAPSITESAYRLIQKNYCCKFDANMLGTELGISYKYLSSLFKKEYGMSMQKFHNLYRMQEAAKLLRTSYLTIGEISGKLGFDDQLYFSRCFKQIHSISPLEFRKEFNA